MGNSPTILVVGATLEQAAQVKDCLPDWGCLQVSLSDEGKPSVSPTTSKPTVILVFARKEQEKTVSICEEIRNLPEIASVPILLAVGTYDITRGNAVKRMGNAEFVTTPFTEKSLRAKIATVLEV